MKFLRLLLAAFFLGLCVAPPTPALADNEPAKHYSPKYAPAGWEVIAFGTTSGLTTGTTVLSAPAFHDGYTAVRASLFCTFTGAVSGRLKPFFSETDPAGNGFQTITSTTDNADTGTILTGSTTTGIVMQMGWTDTRNAAAAAYTYFYYGHVPFPYFGLSIFVGGTFTTNSCVWYIHGFRG